MASLGDLYFALGLDDKQFNNAIEAAKQKVKDLGADVSIGVKLDVEGIGKQIQSELAKYQNGVKISVDDSELQNVREQLKESKAELEKLNSAKFKNVSAIDSVEGRIKHWEKKEAELLSKMQSQKPVQVSVELNKEGLAEIQQKLNSLSTPITTKLTLEYDIDKFQSAATALKNYTDRLNELGKIRLGIDDSFLRTGVGSSYEKGLKGWLSKASDYILGEDSGEINKSIGSIQKILNNYTFKLKTDIDEQHIISSLNSISKKKVPLGVDVKIDIDAIQKKLKSLKIPLGFNSNEAINSVKEKLKKETFKAKLNLVIDKANISNAIKEAFAKKGLEYAATPSDVRNARILEIQQRMENNQAKFNRQIKNSSNAMNKFRNSTISASDWVSQLGNQLTNVFSIYAIERFIRNLYTVGGEFQKQQIALRTMIGDVEKGDVVFERIKDMAVKSPFTFSELSSYTKQMAAYGIEYEELYDTTKRLADISAGVGVDMGRLILAYGQVRSAEVLRGQELRQFTEAGIPLVAELAKRLSEVRGEAVKVGEVFDAISKRQVSFDMVKDVLFDMTDPGGKFFEMQEELAKSLAGQWSNLKDAWDIFIADIANSSNNVLSGLAKTLNDILRNWREWVPALTSIVGLIGAITTVIRGATIATSVWNAVSTANPWMKLASVILGAVGAIGGWIIGSDVASKNTAQLNTELDEEIQKWNENRTNALRYVDTLMSANTTEERRILLYKELIDLYPDLFKNMKLEELMLKDIANIKTDINEETLSIQLTAIDKRISDEQKKIDDINKSKKRTTARGATIYKPLTDEESQIIKNAKAEIESLELRRKELQKIIDREGLIKALKPDSDISKYIEVYKELGKSVKIIRQGGILGEIANPKEGTTILEYYNQLNEALKEQNEIKAKFKPTTNEYKDANRLAKVYQSAIDAIGGVWSSGGRGGKSPAEEAAERDAKAYLDALKAKMSELGSQWNLYKDLFEATGNKNLSMNIAFDGVIPNFDSYIEQLKGLMKNEIQKRGLGISVDELLSEGKEGIAKRVNDKSLTAWTEEAANSLNAIIDSYNNANKKLREGTVRDFLNIIKNSKDFAQQISNIEAELQRNLASLRKIATEGGMPTDELKRHEDELIKRAEEEKTKVRFEEFKESSDWVKVFDDLDRVSDATLDNMISKIEEFAKQAHLSEEVTKQLVEAMAKLRDEAIERNPFEGFKDAWNRLKYLKSGVLTESGMVRFGSGTQQDPYTFKNNKDVNNEISEANDDLKDSALAVADKFQAVANAADLLGGLFENLGIDLGGLKDIFGGAASGAQTGAGIASAFGLAGPWGAIAGAAVGMLSSVFAMHDKALQKEIEASEAREKLIKNIADNLEAALEKQIGGIYTMSIDSETRQLLKGFTTRLDASSLDSFLRGNKFYSNDTRKTANEALRENSYYDAQLAALMAQRDEMEHQMELEGEKKKTDKSKMADYEQSIKELKVQIDSFAEDMANTLYGIDFKDWASQFTDSIVNAWANGEDAAEAYKKTVSDVMRNVAASVIQQGIIGKWLEDNMDKVLDLFAKNNGKITDEVYSAMVDLAEGLGVKVEEIETFMEAWEKLLNEKGYSMKDLEKTSGGGLSKEIQGVTEDTAGLLASYLNALRHDVSVKRSIIEKLVGEDIPKMSLIAQAQLTQLNNIASNTLRNAEAADKIYDLFNRVVDKGGNKLKI